MSRYYLTTFTFKVLSEDAPVDDAEPNELVDLIDAGPCVGTYESSSEEISPKTAAELLSAFGSEPGFFRLDENGDPEEEESSE